MFRSVVLFAILRFVVSREPEDDFLSLLRPHKDSYSLYLAFESSIVNSGYSTTREIPEPVIRGALNVLTWKAIDLSACSASNVTSLLKIFHENTLKDGFLMSVLDSLEYRNMEFQLFRMKLTTLANRLLLESVFCIVLSRDPQLHAQLSKQHRFVNGIIEELRRAELHRQANYWPEHLLRATENFASDELRMIEEPQVAVDVLSEFLIENYGFPRSKGDVLHVFDRGARLFTVIRLSNATSKFVNADIDGIFQKTLQNLTSNCLTDAHDIQKLADTFFHITQSDVSFPSYYINAIFPNSGAEQPFWSSKASSLATTKAIPQQFRLCSSGQTPQNVVFVVVLAS